MTTLGEHQQLLDYLQYNRISTVRLDRKVIERIWHPALRDGTTGSVRKAYYIRTIEAELAYGLGRSGINLTELTDQGWNWQQDCLADCRPERAFRYPELGRILIRFHYYD